MEITVFWVVAVFILGIVLLTIYFLPTIIAVRRDKKNALAIFVLNLFAGITCFGWIAVLIWSVMYEEKDNKKKK